MTPLVWIALVAVLVLLALWGVLRWLIHGLTIFDDYPELSPRGSGDSEPWA